MRKIIVHEFMSLDGVIQAPGSPEEDTEGGFDRGGWTVPYWHNDIGEQFDKAFSDVDTLLLGRKTWQIHGAAFEPMKPGDQFGDAMNAMEKFVVSSTLESTGLWRNTTPIKENVAEEVRKLKKKSGKNILIDGSSVLIHTLIENDLIDELNLHIYPVVLGSGKRIFSENTHIDLKLVTSKTLATGVVYLEYKFVKKGGD